MSAQENQNTVLSSLLICTNSQRWTQIDFPFMLHLICHSPITPKWVRMKPARLEFLPSSVDWNPIKRKWPNVGSVIVLPGNSDFSNNVLFDMVTLHYSKGLKGKFSMEYISALCAVYIHLLFLREREILLYLHALDSRSNLSSVSHSAKFNCTLGMFADYSCNTGSDAGQKRHL